MENEPEWGDSMIEAFEEMVRLFTEKELFSGVVLLARNGHPLYQKACGEANRMCGMPNRIETRFATASITKMFTAVAVVQMIEAGRLSWDTAVVAYLGLQDAAFSKAITISQLLTHTSGIADYMADEDPAGFENLWKTIGPCSVDSPGKLLPFFMDESPIQEPGIGFDYNNAGYILLGLILEKAAGLPYEEVIRRQIFQRAGMNHSDFIPLTRVVADVAEGYMPLRDGENFLMGWERNIYSLPAYGLPDGGAYCTAWDLVHFMRALRGGVLLNDHFTESILKPHVVVDNKWQYGYGIWFDTEADVSVRYGHTGEDPGVSARVYHYPIFNLDLVILGNQSYCAGDLDWQLHQIVMEEASKLAEKEHSK